MCISFSQLEFMQVPAEEWQSKMEASVKEVKKLEDNYTAKGQSLKVRVVFFTKSSKTKLINENFFTNQLMSHEIVRF